MIRFTHSFIFNRQPRCPICQSNLVQGCWEVRGGIAFCSICAAGAPIGSRLSRNPPPNSGVLSYLAWFHTSDHGPFYTECSGIRFYTPHEHATRETAAHLDPWHGDRAQSSDPIQTIVEDL